MNHDFNGTLPNGVELYTRLDPRLETFSLGLWVRGGAMGNAPGEHGLAHFLEHAVFRAASERMGGGLYAALSARGLQFDAVTSDAYVRFEMTGPSEAFDTGLELLLGVLKPPILSMEGMRLERLRIQAEIRENDSEGSYDQFARRHVWRDTPLDRTIAGSVNGANRVGFDALAREHARWFRRGNFFFAAAGNVPDPEALHMRLAAIEPDDAVPEEPWPWPVPVDFFHRNAAVHFGEQYGAHLTFWFDVDAAAFSPTALNLAQGALLNESGLLYLALSENSGLAYDIDGYLQYHGPVAGLTFDFSVEPGRIGEGVRAVVECLNAAKELSDADAAAIRQGALAAERCQQDDPAAVAYDWALENGILGCGWQSREDRVAAIEAVSPAELRQIFRTVCAPDNVTLCVHGSPRRVRPEALRAILRQL